MNRNSYEYRRGFLDGSGNSRRITGKTTKKILEAILEMLEGEKVVFICDSYSMCNYSLKKACRILDSLDLGWVSVVVSKARITTAFNDGSLHFIPHDRINDFLRGNTNCLIIDDRS